MCWILSCDPIIVPMYWNWEIIELQTLTDRLKQIYMKVMPEHEDNSTFQGVTFHLTAKKQQRPLPQPSED